MKNEIVLKGFSIMIDSVKDLITKKTDYVKQKHMNYLVINI